MDNNTTLYLGEIFTYPNFIDEKINKFTRQ